MPCGSPAPSTRRQPRTWLRRRSPGPSATGGVRQGTNPAGYVYRVAFRLLRRRGGLPQTALDDVDELATAGTTTEDAAVANVSAARALAAMPPRRRACATLCWYLGFTSEEAADILGIDAATVRTHLERARRSATPASLA